MGCCPFSDAELHYWDRSVAPMGEGCYSCEEYDCKHNFNMDNPELVSLGDEYSALFQEEL